MPVKKTSQPRNLLLAALILRLFLSAFFFHPDIKSQHFHARFVSHGVSNIYSFIAENLPNLPYRDTFNYPPLTYYLLGGWNVVASFILGPEFTAWLNDWGPGGYSHPRMFEFMLVLKFPYLLLDFLIGFLLLKINASQKSANLISVFWFFNPVSLYGIYMLSQFDVISSFLTVAALLLTKNRRPATAAVLLGLATMLKSYPLLLFPYVLFRAKNIRTAVTAICGFLLGAVIPVLPVITSSAFVLTMSNSNLMQRIFAAGIDIGGAQRLPIYVVTYITTLWLSWQRRSNVDLLPEFLTATLSVLLVSHFHAQWAIWSLPFVTLTLARFPRIWPVLFAAGVGLFATNFLLADRYAFLGLFSAINPAVIFFPSIPEMISPAIDPILLQSLFHTLLAGSGFWIIYQVWQNHETK